MFADSLLDSARAHDSRRRWTTALSFAVQALAVGVLLLLPLICGEGLPAVLRWSATVAAPAPPPGPSAPPHTQHAAASTSNLNADGRPIQPTSIPAHTADIREEVAPPPVDVGWSVAGGTGDRAAYNRLLHSIIGSVSSALPPAAHPTITRPPVTSSVMEGNLIHKVQPEYPPLARQVRIQGTVVFEAIISREGTIENLQAVSGNPMLVPAAMAAVRQWRYRPYLLNGVPVEVETQVTVNFLLGGG